MKRALLLLVVVASATACTGRTQKGTTIQRQHDDTAEHRAPASDFGGERAIGQR